MTEEKRREVLDDLNSFINVHDDETLNEAVNEERTQLERTEVEDERVQRDSLMELMEMKRKQRELRKRYREKHPEVIRDQNRRYRQKNPEKLTEIKWKKNRKAHPEGGSRHQKTAIRRAEEETPPEGVHNY